MKNLEAVELLINRNSMKMVVAPAPSDEELALALQAAVAAPDHGNLTPWRFKLIRGESGEGGAPNVPAEIIAC